MAALGPWPTPANQASKSSEGKACRPEWAVREPVVGKSQLGLG